MVNSKGNRYVAHLDILGMASLIEKNPEEAWGLLSDLVAVRDEMINYDIELINDRKTIAFQECIKIVTFSDTMLLFTFGDSPEELRCIIVLLTEIFHKALTKCVPIRAGLSYGIFHFNFDKSMYSGPALLDAYRVGEAAQWLGIVLSDTVEEKAISILNQVEDGNVIVGWNLPVKGSIKKCWVVNWPTVFSHTLTANPPISVEDFYQAFERSFGRFDQLPTGVRQKYQNTVDFVNTQLRGS